MQAAGEIDWSRAIIDASYVQAKKGGSGLGPSPVDRGRPGVKHHVVVDGHGLPLAWSATPANRNDVTQLLPLIDAIPHVPSRIGRPRHRPARLIADRHNKRRLLVRTDRSHETHEALLSLAACLLCYRRFRSSFC